MGVFSKLKDALTKTKEGALSGISSVFTAFSKVDDELYDELEECLIISDIGATTAGTIIDELKARVKKEKVSETDAVKELLKEIMIENIETEKKEEEYPLIILMVGVNGVGKTTTIGKLANLYKAKGKTVTLAAADTFRAAAAEQLSEWGNRADCQVIKHGEGADPAAVVFDALSSAKAKKTDVLIVDTAGRLHNKKNLMDELNKIRRIIEKNYPEANCETLLALDATTGQNGLMQAEVFSEVADVDYICLNKLDGTAKGGIILGIKNKLGIGVKYVGVGEGIDDLLEFDPREFVNAIIE